MKHHCLKLILASLIASPALAGPSPLVVTRDLDVATARVIVTPADFVSPGARTNLDHRIRSAIEVVCGSYATIETDQTLTMDDCWQHARRQADDQLQVAFAQGGGQLQLTAR